MKEKNRNLFYTHSDFLNDNYGKKGTKKREVFERNAKEFMLKEMLKEERKKANLTQEQLANKMNIKKSLYF